MDYGHPLEFGTFITPTNSAPKTPVALARLSEQLGYDLVTFQDHPYQPRFLDTWTLMTWVAAQTERIHISANVLNLPMRPPAVIARAAASLDLLSEGRFDLALGAGGFWDAMEAMGARRLGPGESVDALSEAIDVIRGIWAVSERAPLRVQGEHYKLNGAKRGPAPAHDMPIWLGAYKPRMLRLIGQKADGWLPSMAYLKQGELRTGMAVIDDGADRAGRDPREIRRLLNIGGQFARRRVTDSCRAPARNGSSSCCRWRWRTGSAPSFSASDDPDVLQQFAQEVVPAVREAVDQERSAGVSPPATMRSQDSPGAAAARRHRL